MRRDTSVVSLRCLLSAQNAPNDTLADDDRVDYNQTSNVWAQDKWKGVFKVKWIFVRDVPNG